MGGVGAGRRGPGRRGAERAVRLRAALPEPMPEEVDPASGEALGNTPLVRSHMGVARAMSLLDVARLRRRWTVAGLGAWRVAVHLAMRRRRRRGGAPAGSAGDAVPGPSPR